jgi:predicted ATPase
MPRQSTLFLACLDLATANQSVAVATFLAQALRLQATSFDCLSEDPLLQLTRDLKSRQMLLVFDSCEPVSKDTAMLIEAILRNAPKYAILDTSRQPLRAEGEFVLELTPLQVSPGGDQMDCIKSTELSGHHAVGRPAGRA